MGIVNLTPDSFYPGSRVSNEAALSRIEKMFRDGAHVVDLGACSTRPGAPRPSLEEEWARLEPTLKVLATVMPGHDRVSIDTYRPEIVRRAYKLIGPFIVNDVGGGEPEMLETVGELGLTYVAMHSREHSVNIVTDVIDFFREFAVRAEKAGISNWILDPGFGFGKTIEENYELLRRLEELLPLGREVMVAISRKSMIYKVLGITPDEAMPATLALEMSSLERGATWLRVHDVKETADLVKVYSAMYTSSPGAAK